MAKPVKIAPRTHNKGAKVATKTKQPVATTATVTAKAPVKNDASKEGPGARSLVPRAPSGRSGAQSVHVVAAFRRGRGPVVRGFPAGRGLDVPASRAP